MSEVFNATESARSDQQVDHQQDEKKGAGNGQGGTPQAKKKINAVEIEGFMKQELEPREHILNPWLPVQGLTMVHAARGIGKTYFALHAAYAVACGSSFLKWNAPQPRGVLYIDGEMPSSVLQERLARIIAASDEEPQRPFRIITPDLQPIGMLDLSRHDDQRELESHLDDIELVVVDNLSTLVRCGRENEAESWLPVQGWALQQRAKGRSVLFVHHDGKSGEQRGTSRREDVLDTDISLRRPRNYQQENGAQFEVNFTKARGFYGMEARSLVAKLTLTKKDGREIQQWEWQDIDESNLEKVKELKSEGMSQTEIAIELELSKGYVSKLLKRASGG